MRVRDNMFWFRKKTKLRTKAENTWRLENEIYRNIHELESLFKKLEETKEKGKKEKNINLQQLIANEYLFIENKIKMQTISLKEMQKTYLENQDYLNKEQLLDTYKIIDDFTISSIADLKKIVLKIKDIQESKQEEDKERKDINDVFEDSLNNYGSNLENDRAKSLTEAWARENEDEQLINESNKEDLSNNPLEEN